MPATTIAAMDQVEMVLDGFFETSCARASGMGRQYGQLWETLKRNTQGGKRFRPRLVMTVFAGLGGTDTYQAAHVAAAFEMLHTALIIHDDVIDHDTRRRGAPNLAGIYQHHARRSGLEPAEAAHRGTSAAIVAGGLALTSTFRLITGAQLPADLQNRMLNLLDEAVFASAGGEILDVEFSAPSAAPALSDVMDMCRLKTAVYSFEAPMRAGALLAGAGEDTAELVGNVGRLTGTAYQLIDDLLGIFGNEAVTGKSTVSDLVEGKYTLLMSYASTTGNWSEIRQLLDQPVFSASHAGAVRMLLESCGARGYVEAQAGRCTRDALELLETSALPEFLTAELSSLLDHAVVRSS